MRTLALREQTGGLITYAPSGGGTAGVAAYPIRFTGTAGTYISSPDSVLNSWAGDLDIRVKCSFASMNPAGNQAMIAKRLPDGNAGSWAFRMNPGGTLDFPFWNSASGVTIPNSTSGLSAISGIVANQVCWVRATLDVDNGAGGNTTRFYYSLDGLYYQPLGGPATNAGVADVGDFVNVLLIGGTLGQEFAGTVHYAEVRGGIDGPILAKFDPALAAITTATTPTTINGWTWNGTTLYKRDDYVRFPGTAGNYLSYPSVTANRITGDIELVWHGSLDNWAAGTVRDLISKFNSGTNQRSYMLSLSAANQLSFFWSANGTASNSVFGNSVAGLAAGSYKWLKVTFAVATGTALFYTSDDGWQWTAAGAPAAFGATSIFDGTALLQISGKGDDIEHFAGTCVYAAVKNGIGGPIGTYFDGRNVQTPWAITGTGWSWDSSQPVSTKPVLAFYSPSTTAGQAWVTTPHTAAQALTDADIRVAVALDNWADGVSFQAFIAKRDGTADAWQLRVNPDGTLALLVFSGAANVGTNTPAPLGYAPGALAWLRSTYDADNGAAGRTLTFYSSPDAGISWVPIGSPIVTAGVKAIDASVAPITIAAGGFGTAQMMKGKVLYAEVRNGIDGPIVLRYDPTGIAKQNRPSNLLNANQSGIETDATGWASVNQSPTLARSTAQALDGAASLSITATSAAGALSARTSPTTAVPVTVGVAYTSTMWVRGTGSAAPAQAAIYWYTSGGAFVSASTGTSAIAPSGTWTQYSATAVAPATAAYGTPVFQSSGALPTIGDVWFVDRVTFMEQGLPTTTVQPGGTPNMLTPNQASIETDASGWTTSTGAPTLAQDATQFLDGTKSLSITAVAAGPAVMAAKVAGSGVPVIPGKLYTATLSNRAATTGQNCQTLIRWEDASHVFISNSTGSNVADSSAGWTASTVTGVAPANAAFGIPVNVINGAVAGEVHYVDRISLVEAATVWTMSGTQWDLVAA